MAVPQKIFPVVIFTCTDLYWLVPTAIRPVHLQCGIAEFLGSEYHLPPLALVARTACTRGRAGASPRCLPTHPARLAAPQAWPRREQHFKEQARERLTDSTLPRFSGNASKPRLFLAQEPQAKGCDHKWRRFHGSKTAQKPRQERPLCRNPTHKTSSPPSGACSFPAVQSVRQAWTMPLLTELGNIFCPASTKMPPLRGPGG